MIGYRALRATALILLVWTALGVMDEEPVQGAVASSGHLDHCLSCACCVVTTDATVVATVEEAIPIEGRIVPRRGLPDPAPAFPPPRG
jgi:glyoxylase-like metal-dependent hydrolase (beta-lactamase superfamily II)